MVKDTAEVVAEAVEDAATVAEKVSSEVAEQLPENGRLRTAAVLLENASKEVAEEAHLAQNIIHKLDEIEERVNAIMNPSKHEDKNTRIFSERGRDHKKCKDS